MSRNAELGGNVEAQLKLLAVFTAVGSKEEAQRIATSLVERKLVACAQISAIERGGAPLFQRSARHGLPVRCA